MDINLFTGFLAGLTSFITPCVLPMVPVYLMYLTGSGDIKDLKEDTRKTFIRSVAFVLGFTIVFVLLGLGATAAGNFLVRNKLLLQKIGAVLIVFFGIVMTGLIKLPTMSGRGNMRDAHGFFGAMSMGMAFSIGWSPCFGPVLGTILLIASNQESLLQGALLLLSYSIGLGIPFVISGFFASPIRVFIKKHDKWMKVFAIVAGLIMIIFGILMYFNKLAFLANV